MYLSQLESCCNSAWTITVDPCASQTHRSWPDEGHRTWPKRWEPGQEERRAQSSTCNASTRRSLLPFNHWVCHRRLTEVIHTWKIQRADNCLLMWFHAIPAILCMRVSSTVAWRIIRYGRYGTCPWCKFGKGHHWRRSFHSKIVWPE